MADMDFIRDLQGVSLRNTDYYVGPREFWGLGDDEIPSSPGAYILLANTRFPYPQGKNSVYYIGQAANLRRRLLTHLRFAKQAKTDRRRSLYWPRYEYAAVYGARYCYVHTWQGLKPKALEDHLMALFAIKHYSFPVANGAGAWNRIEKTANRLHSIIAR